MNRRITRLTAVLFVVSTMTILPVYTQVNIDDCQQKARENYPLVKQFGLLEKAEMYNLANASKAYLPQLSLSAQATYQSDITSLPPALGQALSKAIGQPVNFESIQKDQYRLVAEVNQLLWDGGGVRIQQEGIRMGTRIEKQKLEVELHTLKERINQLYFGILALHEQHTQLTLLHNELRANYNKVHAMWTNGVAGQPDLDAIKVELLKVKQKEAELLSVGQAYRRMLVVMTGDSTVAREELARPSVPLLSDTIQRPELELLTLQKEYISTQEKSVRASNLPRAGAFFQGGYGNPGLNMLVPGFTPWYLVGARLSWNISGFYTQKNKLNNLATSRKTADVQRETFLHNTRMKTEQLHQKINKIREQLKSDDEIVMLRGQIKKAAEVRVENGTLTVNDLLREITAENTAIQEKKLREIELLMVMYELKIISNN